MDESPVLATMAAHRTIRRFAPEPVDEELLRAAVEAASRASTSSHAQAYCALRVVDPGERAELARLCGGQAQVREAGAFLVVCGDQRRHALVAARAGAPFAPNLESFLVAVIDASLFAQNLALACEAQGLGVCFIGGLRNELAEVDRLLELPAGVLPLYGLCLGRPAEEPTPRPRLSYEALCPTGRYPSDAEVLAQIDRHDAEMAAYYEARGAPGRDWSGGVWRKFRAPAREHLAAFYAAKGARLE